MTTQIAILMILLQILIGCGEHLDVCKHGQVSNPTVSTTELLEENEDWDEEDWTE